MVWYVGDLFKLEENWNDSKQGSAILSKKYILSSFIVGTLICILSQMCHYFRSRKYPLSG